MNRKASFQLVLLAIATTTFVWTLCCALEATEPIVSTEQESFELELRVSTHDGSPVPGAKLRLSEQEVGVTDAQGTIALKLQRIDESVLDLDVVCPSGYVDETTRLRIVLQPLIALDQTTIRRHFERHVVCSPKEQTAILVVKAPGASLSPVVVDGKIAGTTDLSGAARFAYRLRPQAVLEVKIDTSARPELIPQSPIRTFTMAQEDTLFVFEQAFEIDQRRHPTHAPIQSSPAHRAPYRLN